MDSKLRSTRGRRAASLRFRGRGALLAAVLGAPAFLGTAPWVPATALGLVIAASPSVASALDAGDAQREAKANISAVEGRLGSLQRVAVEPRRHEPQKLVAAAQLHLGNKNYDGAIDELNKVVELHAQGKVTPATYADATFLLAEAYFASGQLYSAKRSYEVIVDKGNQAPFDTFAGRAASRLVDVALQTQNLESLDGVLERLNRLGSTDSTGALHYARGKLLFAKGDYAGAEAAAKSAPAGAAFAHRLGYLQGVIRTKQALAAAPKNARGEAEPDFNEAIQTFRTVAQLPAKDETEQHIVDLSWMAAGRLLYNGENYLDAAKAYTRVPRTSPEFSTALYELGWTYVRLGDYERAQRTLEVLSLLDPGRIDAADAALLRADLLLRSGRFEKALLAYEEVREEYDPLRIQVDTFLQANEDPAVYYDKLTADEIESSADLPPMAIEWAREEAKEGRVFAVIDEVSRSRSLIKRSRRLVAQLNAVLGTKTRAKIFPAVEKQLEDVLGLVNQLSSSRYALARGMDSEAGSAGGELAQVREERRKLMSIVGRLPVNAGDFARRETATNRKWNSVAQELQRLSLRADYLQAMVNGLRRVLAEKERFQLTADPESLARFQAEIEANEKDLATYRARISTLRDAIEIGRAQIGFGDEVYLVDDEARARFRELFAREVALTASGGDSSAADYARTIQPLLARADAAEAKLISFRTGLESDVEVRSRDFMAIVEREAAAVESQAAHLDTLDQHARILVGEVAMHNFRQVQERLKNVVLRADVGVVQHAWELREEQRNRVRDLQRERAREERFLNEELREVLDDAEGME